VTRTIEWLHRKLQTRPLIRESTPQKQDHDFQTATSQQEVISGASVKIKNYLCVEHACIHALHRQSTPNNLHKNNICRGISCFTAILLSANRCCNWILQVLGQSLKILNLWPSDACEEDLQPQVRDPDASGTLWTGQRLKINARNIQGCFPLNFTVSNQGAWHTGQRLREYGTYCVRGSSVTVERLVLKCSRIYVFCASLNMKICLLVCLLFVHVALCLQSLCVCGRMTWMNEYQSAIFLF
jgi:hypothetical protein